jgi:hypothetical protein
VGLLTLPGIYAFFALQAGEQAVGVKEMIYGVPFVVAGLVFAFVSVRQSAVVVGVFWLLHGLYDLRIVNSSNPALLISHFRFVVTLLSARIFQAIAACS